MPLWAVSLGWELRRGRQVIMHGAVNDRYWFRGAPAGLREVLTSYLSYTGSKAVYWWDPVDGLTVPAAGSAGRLGPAPDGTRLTAGASLREVIGAARWLAARPDQECAFIFQDIDVVLDADEAGTAVEYLRLRAAMNAAVEPAGRRGPAPHSRNPVLVVTGDITRLPAWFHQEDPRVQPLRLAPPDPAERRLWLSMLRAEFNGARTSADLESLVTVTEGLAGWQLDALARTSVIRKVPVQKVGKLLDVYRFNVRSNPWAQLNAATVRDCGAALGKRVIGQDRAVAAVARTLHQAYAGVDFGGPLSARPRGVFFFVGPTGVGKTELAKAIAALIFGDERAMARFDMSEYAQEHAAERLAGAPPGYTGYEAGGELTRHVQQHPFSVLLFDEVEKANPAVLDKFLQILEDGRLTDGRGETAYFSQSLVVFTSNVGSGVLRDRLAAAPPGEVIDYPAIEELFSDAVRQKFDEINRPEIFGRLEPGIVVFDLLRPQHFAGIATRLLDELAENVRENHGVTLTADREALLGWVARQMRDLDKVRYGGRQIRNEMEQARAAYIDYFMAADPPPGTEVRLDVSPAGAFSVTEAAPGAGGTR